MSLQWRMLISQMACSSDSQFNIECS